MLLTTPNFKLPSLSCRREIVTGWSVVVFSSRPILTLGSSTMWVHECVAALGCEQPPNWLLVGFLLPLSVDVSLEVPPKETWAKVKKSVNRAKLGFHGLKRQSRRAPCASSRLVFQSFVLEVSENRSGSFAIGKVCIFHLAGSHHSLHSKSGHYFVFSTSNCT